MTGGVGTMDDLASAGEAEWWYRAGGGTSGPVTSAELRRLSAAAGPLDAETPVWKRDFGETWRRLVDAFPGDPDGSGPPVVDRGRWAKSFAKTEAHPRRAQWSWLGLLGPVGYLWVTSCIAPITREARPSRPRTMWHRSTTSA